MTTIEVLSDNIDTTSTAVSDTVLELTPKTDKPTATVLSDDDIKNWLEKKRKQRLKLNLALLFVAVLIIILLKIFIPATSTIDKGVDDLHEKTETTDGSQTDTTSRNDFSLLVDSSNKDSLIPPEIEVDEEVDFSLFSTTNDLQKTLHIVQSSSSESSSTSRNPNSTQIYEPGGIIDTEYSKNEAYFQTLDFL